MSSTPGSLKGSFWGARIVSESPERTQALGAALAGFLAPGSFVALFGVLGTGKTEFVRGFAEGLGITGVKSPSFVVENIYGSGPKIYHFDLFRLKGPVDPEEIGLSDALAKGDGCVFLEWADRSEWLPDERMEVAFFHRKEHERSLEMVSYLSWFDHEGFMERIRAERFRYELY